jgi:hypothetical protein
LDSIYESIKQTIRERLGSPLIGSFAIAWALINYRFILILASGLQIDYKLQYAHTASFPTGWAIFLSGFLYPIICSSIYIFGYPFPALGILRFRAWMQVKEDAARQKYEGNMRLSLPESQSIITSNAKREEDYRNQIAKLSVELGALRGENERLTAEINRNPEAAAAVLKGPPKYGSERDEAGITSIMRALISSNGEATERTIQDSIQQDYISTQRFIDEGVRLGLFIRTQVNNLPGVTFTTAGRNFAVSSNTFRVPV